MYRDARSKLMMFSAILFGIYSILWGLAPFDSVNLPARLILDLADWPLSNYHDSLDKNTKFLSSIGAGLLSAVSIILMGIVVPAIKEGNQSILRVTGLAIITWYIIDGIGSIGSGVASNIIFNTIYLLLVLIPLFWRNRDEEKAYKALSN